MNAKEANKLASEANIGYVEEYLKEVLSYIKLKAQAGYFRLNYPFDEGGYDFDVVIKENLEELGYTVEIFRDKVFHPFKDYFKITW